MSGSESKKEKGRIESLELNRETIENLSEEEAEHVQGGLAARDTDVRSGNRCCSAPCYKVER